jgi:hypothetical protein
MKHKSCFLFGLSLLLICCSGVTWAQVTNKFVRKQVKGYWRDQMQRPWNDLSYQMAIRIDPVYAQSLGNTNEIASDETPQLVYAVGEWHYFSLKSDANGTYADVDVLVYADKDDPVAYQVELQKNGKAVPFTSGSSKVEIRNNTPSLPTIGLRQSNAIFLKDWMIIAGVLLIGAILLYLLVFRWLFRGLLFNRRWGVSSAEHFTWSLSLLGMLAIAAGLTLFYLGPRLETWIIIGVMGAFWLLHAGVWLASGKEA